MVRLTDRLDMTLDVYRDVKQQYNNNNIGSWVQNEIHLKTFFLQNCMAQVLEIYTVASPCGPLPNLFKRRSQGLRWPALGGRRSKP